MNQDEILSMPAGQEMDLLISEKVLSLSVDEWNKRFFRNQSHYSTDISAAWEVAKKLSDKWDFAIVNNQNFRNYPGLHFGFRLQSLDEDSHIKTVFALGETAPLAICRAALLIMAGSNNACTRPAFGSDGLCDSTNTAGG